ncbi:MAG: arginine repressor [Ruminococcus sp.]|nr:arginine repressor [Ruminococcus sp.]
MKSSRHSKILELVNEYDINTQEELLNRLTESGFKVTQATVSRDIKELRLLKTLGPNGKYRYTSGVRRSLDNQSGFENLFSSSSLSVESAENIVVVKTMSGMAQAVCASLDNTNNENIIGTIAGDDTIFMVVKTKADAVQLVGEFRKLL